MRAPQRGRAILRRLTTQDAQDATLTFRPGDFLLTSSDAGLATLMRVATGGPLNHAALIVDTAGTLVEANPALLGDARAYRLSSVRAYLRAGRPCWIGYVELREGTREDVVAYAEHLLRAGGLVSPLGRLWLATHTLLSVGPRARTARHPRLRGLRAYFDRHALVLREELCYASGEFVARALERGGFLWDRDPAHVTPDDLFQRYYLPDLTTITPMRPSRLSDTRHHDPDQTHGTITPFARRPAQRNGRASATPYNAAGATALQLAPASEEAPQAGMRALLQVGVLTAAGLALLGALEELLQLITPEA